MPDLDFISRFLDSSATLGMTWPVGGGATAAGRFPPAVVYAILYPDQKMGNLLPVANLVHPATMFRMNGYGFPRNRLQEAYPP